MSPNVLISDALSPAAVAIFKDRGLNVEFQPKLGADKERLADVSHVRYRAETREYVWRVLAGILEREKNQLSGNPYGEAGDRQPLHRGTL